jgi:hypothetical protein
VLLHKFDPGHDLGGPRLFHPVFVKQDGRSSATIRPDIGYLGLHRCRIFPVMGAYVTFARLCPDVATMLKTMHPTPSP